MRVTSRLAAVVVDVLVVLALSLIASAARAADPPAAAAPAAEVQALLCRDYQDGKIIDPTVKYAPDSPKFQVVLRSPSRREGVAVTFVWIAEDVGKAAPPNTKIDQKTVNLPGSPLKALTWTADSSLSRPNNGWPVGRYRVDVYFGNTVVKSLRFSVEGK